MSHGGVKDHPATPTRERTTRRYYREERRDDPRVVESRDSYLNIESRDVVPRPREDSDLSIEEIRRDFPPPGYSSRDVRRARSAEPGYEYDDRSYYSRDRDHDDRDYDRGYDRGYDRYSHRKTDSVYYAEEEEKKARMLGKQEQIIAAITGAALAIGGKELYDRRSASQRGSNVERNVLTSAALGAAGAFAGYQGAELYNKRKEKDEKKSTLVVHKGRDGRAYYSDDEESIKDKKSHKSFLKSALAAAGLGGAVKALTGGSSHRDDRSDTRSRRGSRSRSRSNGRGEGSNKIQKAAMASLIAGATEAFRVSKEPGGWKGEKAKRILTAAAGAATIDAAQSTDKAGSKMGLAESVIGGLLGNRVLNGSKKNIEEDEKTGRSRSRSRARSSSKGGGGPGRVSIAALATAGLGAFGAKKIIDHSRSRSRNRSVDSRDSRNGSPDRRHRSRSRDGSPDRRHRSRSRSVVDKARKGLANLGLGNGMEDDREYRDRKRDQDDHDDSPRASRRQRSDRGSTAAKRRDSSRGSVSSSDLGDSDEDEKRAKKMRGKQIITTGLAAVATIHAAHSVYESVEKRKVRQRAVKEGLLSPEEAKKLKRKALLQDAASIGIAALGIKGAISELKEAREIAHEMHEWKEKKEERHQRRLERLRRPKESGGSDDYRNRRSRANSWSPPAPSPKWCEGGPRYSDGNPYSAW
ncbi:hypothetical protein B0T17DRAFT_610387 [Bombardia bombarda]|uniref:Uncharacterized protein n=1 Tax=Bombardia bombarda TaxID=252184 RepID=A0AA39TUK2_9PEZI|nr:hypothetical protein B0T17DRAFT_610387 [Bombardia bombarda]